MHLLYTFEKKNEDDPDEYKVCVWGGEGGRLKGNPFFIIFLKANMLCTVLGSGLRCEQRTYS